MSASMSATVTSSTRHAAAARSALKTCAKPTGRTVSRVRGVQALRHRAPRRNNPGRRAALTARHNRRMGEASNPANVIPIADLRYRAAVPPIPATLRPATGQLTDALGRPAARPAHLGHRPLQLPLQLLHAQGGLRPRLRLPAAQTSLLSFEEITRLARVFVAHGVQEDPPDRR